MSTVKKKKKLLFINNDTGSYDTQMGLYWILKGLDRDRYEALVTTHQEGALKKQIESLGWPVIKIQRIRLAKHRNPPFHGVGERLTWWLWKRLRGKKVAQLIKKEGIDLIHTNSIVCFEGAYASYKAKIPHIWHIREILPGNRRLFGVFGTRKTLKMVSKFSDKVVCVSDTAKRQFTGWQRRPDKYITIPNGVDTDLFDPDTALLPDEPLRQRFNIPENVTILAYIGDINRQKGFSDLLDACTLMKQDGVEFHLIVIGESDDPRFFQQMQLIIQTTGLADRIHFLGNIREEALPGYMKQFDIFVSPSRIEPFARHLLEAMAMGIPSVGTYAGNASEVIIPHKSGLLAKTAVPGNLAHNIKTLIADPDLRKQLGQAGRERVLSNFTVKHYTESIYALYEEILGHSDQIKLNGVKQS